MLTFQENTGATTPPQIYSTVSRSVVTAPPAHASESQSHGGNVAKLTLHSSQLHMCCTEQ